MSEIEGRRFTVLYATDKRMWPQLFVSLYSLIHNNSCEKFDVHIICEQVDPAFKINVKAFDKSCVVTFTLIDNLNNSFDLAPVGKHIPKAAYYRFLVGKVVPQSVTRVLYLDCDTVIVNNIVDLLNINLDGNMLAAAENRYGADHSKERLQLPPHSKYLNSGVLLIDMKKWRKCNAEHLLANYILNNRQQVVFHDQDALNCVFNSECLLLPERYNFQLLERTEGEATDVAILHYTGAKKPWNASRKERGSSAYWKYFQQTPYADQDSIPTRLQRRIFGWFKRNTSHCS